MAKNKLIACCVLLSSILLGCSCNKSNVDTYANVSYDDQVVSTGNKLTIGDVYDYIVNNEGSEISTILINKIIKEKIDFDDSTISALYKKYLNEYFETTFLEADAYKYNGEFDEELFVKYLKSESYNINCGEGYNSGLLDNSKFTCDYNDFIEKEINYDIYLKILKIQYLLDNESHLIDKNMVRKLTYYKISKGSNDNDVREQLEAHVASIKENYNSTEESTVKSIEDIANLKRKADLDKIAEEYSYLSTAEDSNNSSFKYLNKFTTCGEKRCSIEKGKEYQDNLIMETDYYTTSIVTKSDTQVLYEEIREILFSENVENYFYKIGDKNYLMSPAYASNNDKRINDIILFDNASSNYYLATVDIINTQSSNEDKILAAEVLLDKISDSTVINYCFENLDIEIYDKNIKEMFISKYGEYDKE